jgi:hypothetical protein
MAVIADDSFDSSRKSAGGTSRPRGGRINGKRKRQRERERERERGRERERETRKGGKIQGERDCNGNEKRNEDDRSPSAKGGRVVEKVGGGGGSQNPEGKADRASIIRLDISGIFTKGTRRNACSIS